MSEKHSESEREPLLSQKRRFPQVFRWKVAAIIISVLIAIFLVVDIILLVHYNNSQPRKTNYTFLADLLDYSANKGDTYPAKQFVNIATALSLSYSELWFQSASLVKTWADGGDVLNLDAIGGFFDGDSDHQLFVLTMDDNGSPVVGAAYSHIGFPLPSGDWQNFLTSTTPKQAYYTFEIADRQSVLVGGGSEGFLRMSGSTSNLLKCRVLRLTDSTFTFLQLLSLDFSTATVSAALSSSPQSTICFDGEPADALSRLQSILNVAGATSLKVVKIEVFHLSV